MAVSLAGSISRAISGYNKDIRTHERAISTGKKTLSQLKPADLVQISSLFRATQGLGGARANIDIAISKLNTLANGIQNQLDIVNKAYQLAETVVTNVNLTASDCTSMNLQYQALVGAAGAIQSASAAITDINGTALIGSAAAQAINAIASTNPATTVTFGQIDTTQAILFATANGGNILATATATAGVNAVSANAAVVAASAYLAGLPNVAPNVNDTYARAVTDAAANSATSAQSAAALAQANFVAIQSYATARAGNADVAVYTAIASSAGNIRDVTTAARATIGMATLSSAQGILSNHLAKIENQIDLLSSISESLGDASDAAADTAKEIADTDPIEAANAIKNNQGAKNLLAGLLTNDAQDANNVMNYARGILALPV